MSEPFNKFLNVQIILAILAFLIAWLYPQAVDPLWSWLTQKGILPEEFRPNRATKDLFTKDELTEYNGENGAPIYVAVLGNVYDVSKAVKHYGPGCAYHYFAGRDASVSFITGEFENYIESEADDVLSLKSNDLIGLENWKRFYDTTYTPKGKVIGRFYDSDGTPTNYYFKFLAMLEQARETKTNMEYLREIYPECNLEWDVKTGTHVWCTTSSGGKERSWTGFPRKLYEVGNVSYRCACIRKEDLNNSDIMIKEYENCDPSATECYYKVD